MTPDDNETINTKTNTIMKRRGVILFVCIENAGRSQMAEAFATKLGLMAMSAGTSPSPNILPVVVGVMREIGIDISKKHPRLLTPEMIDKADLVVTMGCSVDRLCPRPMLAQLQKKLVDWDLPDPKGKAISQVRKLRDEIQARISQLAGSR